MELGNTLCSRFPCKAIKAKIKEEILDMHISFVTGERVI